LHIQHENNELRTCPNYNWNSYAHLKNKYWCSCKTLRKETILNYCVFHLRNYYLRNTNDCCICKTIFV